MKKRSLAIILALVLVMAFGTSAFAAQALSGAGFGGFNNYQATPTYSQVYTAGAVVYGANYFNPDGKSNYPYEIYLPNEQNPAQYRIHTNYTKNTDACASCHATHTAVGASLLQWYSTYETCMACHDGTVTTTYDVESGKVANSSHMTAGGAFGNGSEDFASQHNVQGSVSISAAPGGSVVGKDVSAGSGKTISMWTSAFGCESCHTPHGQGGNARILNPDPNGYASLNNKKTYSVEAVTGAVYDANGNHVTLIKGYPYVNTIYVDAVADATYKIDNTAGYSVITGIPATGTITVAGTNSIKVTMNIQGYLTVNETVYHVSGVNTFCGTCHTDYNTQTQAQINGTANANIMGNSANRPGYGALTGEYSKAHRHSVGVDYDYGNASDKTIIGNDKVMKTMGRQISCLTCHYAHGVNQDFWAATLATYMPATTFTEIAGSSALKRIPNMGTCEACHQKGDANQGYAANSTAADPNFGKEGILPLTDYEANAAHASYFAGNSYKDATTCLICHASAGDDFMKSVHWNTDGKSSVNKDFFGGLLAVNDTATATKYNPAGRPAFPNDMPFGMSDRFCGFPGGAAGVSFAYSFSADGGTQEGNSCGKCHASIGTSMPPLFTNMMAQGKGKTAAEIKAANEVKIDCLACHLDRKDYDSLVNKVVVNNPATMSDEFQYGTADHGATPKNEVNGVNVDRPAFDLAKVGKTYKIALPTNENCMTCHEHAMAGPVYKRHALYSKGTDIHAAENMLCVDCHSTSKHLIAKGIQATDLVANDRPDVEVACVSSKCHTSTPHDYTKHTNYTGTLDEHKAKIAELNKHTAKLACQACHVKTETNAYADAAMAYVNQSQAERGYKTRFGNNQNIIFKGGAIFNDFRAYSTNYDGPNSTDAFVPGTVSQAGYLGSIPEAGRSEWMMVQPGNFAWRWFNGTGTGMADAVASFGFYDPYYFNDGFKGFRGTDGNNNPNDDTIYAPWGFGTTPYGPSGLGPDMSGAGMPSLFGMYFGGYAAPNNAAQFAGYNTFDNEMYAGIKKGVSGDKIYPFRKMQAFMPIPRTNFWFLTPHDMYTVKTQGTNTNYLALREAIESPMMYMFFSGMFRPAMDLYADEFGFKYQYNGVMVPDYNEALLDPTPATMMNGNHPFGYNKLVLGLGAAAAQGVMELNGFIYDDHAYWLDDSRGGVNGAQHTALQHMEQGGRAGTPGNPAPASGKPANADQGQDWLIAGQLDTYMYFPMPVDANIMEDHAVAAQEFKTSEGANYEPRTCSECHRTPNGGATPITFDNPNWNPLLPLGMQTMVQDAQSWGSNFTGTVNTSIVPATQTSVIDWKALGYTNQEIQSFTDAATSPIAEGNWAKYDTK